MQTFVILNSGNVFIWRKNHCSSPKNLWPSFAPGPSYSHLCPKGSGLWEPPVFRLSDVPHLSPRQQARDCLLAGTGDKGLPVLATRVNYFWSKFFALLQFSLDFFRWLLLQLTDILTAYERPQVRISQPIPFQVLDPQKMWKWINAYFILFKTFYWDKNLQYIQFTIWTIQWGFFLVYSWCCTIIITTQFWNTSITLKLNPLPPNSTPLTPPDNC